MIARRTMRKGFGTGAPTTRIGLLAAAALALLGLAAPASAQDKTKLINTPAEKFITAPGGVDMRTGRYAYDESDLAIGGQGESAGLQLKRILVADVAGHANPFANLSHNWDIMVSELRINIDDPQSAGSDYKINVHFGGRSMTYQSHSYSTGFEQLSPTAPAPLTYAGDRASASVVYTYTAGDGTVAVFRPLGGGDCSSSRRCAYVSEITETDGTRFSFDYAPSGGASGGAVRLARVTSSRGYALLLEGSGNYVTKACVINLAVTAAPSGGLCPAGVPTASYGYTFAVNATRLASVTGPDNATSGFTYAPAANGAIAMGFVKPGASGPWLTNTFRLRPDEEEVSQEIIESQVFADGQSYAYAFDSSPYVTYKPQSIAGGVYTDALGAQTEARFDWPVAPGANAPGSVCTHFPCPPANVDDQYTTWVYQQTPGPIKIVDPLGRATTFDYCDPAAMAGLPSTEHNRCIVLKAAQSVTDPEGIKSNLKYDGNFNVIEVRRHPKAGVLNPDGSVPADIVTSATYVTSVSKSSNKPLSMTDALGNTTTWTYAPEHGGVLTETGPAVNGVSPQKRYSYAQRTAWAAGGTAAGPPIWLLTSMSTCRTGAPASGGSGCALGAGDEVVTSYLYGPDAAPNNLLVRGEAVTADGVTLLTCFGYDVLGRKVSETTPNAGLTDCPGTSPAGASPYTSFTRYDLDGKVTGTIAPDPDGPGGLGAPAVRNTYDAAGRLIRVEQGALAAWQPESVAPAYWPGFTVYKIIDSSFDSLDRKTREAVSGGGVTASVTEYGYDLSGRLKCTAVRMNPDVWATPLADKCVPGPASATYGTDRISRSVYDAAGQLLQSKEGVGTPLERTEATWSYNGNGQKTSLTDARGYRAEMSYDGFGRQRRWTFPSKTAAGVADPNDYEEYGYDAAGNRTSARKRDGLVFTFQYDALNRVTAKIVPERAGLDPAHTRDVYYSYDNRGLQTAARFDGPSGEGVTTTYDGFGRVSSSTMNLAGSNWTLGHLYDREGNRIRLTHPDTSFFNYDYDPLNRLVGIRENGGAQIAGFSYDGAGRDLAQTANAGATVSTFGYDAAGRIASLAHDLGGGSYDEAIGLSYNPASQIVGRTGSHDIYAWNAAYAANRDYAVNGQNQYISAGPAAFTYDANGNLTSDGSTNFTYDSENRLVAASGGKSAGLSYDPLGRLFQTWGGAAGFVRFAWDDDALIGEYTQSGAMIHRYIHGGDKGADDPLIWYDNFAGGWRRGLHADQQGSIIAVTDMGGTPIAINAYDEYGIPATANTGRFQYTGQAWIPELGMYYYKARVYSPYIGRFMQVDPIGYDGGINLYAYVGSDPVDNADPTGEECVTPNSNTCGKTAVTGFASYLAQNGQRTNQVRIAYDKAAAKLAKTDQAGRSALKTATRALTPAPQRALINLLRPGVGPRANSVAGAARTNPAWTRAAKAMGVAGKIAVPVSIAAGALEIATSDNKARAAASVAGASAGGIGGGIAGAEAGGMAGFFIGGPPGALAGAVAGGVVGSFGGGYLGGEAGGALYDRAND